MGLEIIIYIFLTLGGGSAIITIAIILSNRMYASVYPALILAIQTFNLGICLVDICYTESADCKVSAVFFYFFWMIGNLLTSLIILVIDFDIRRKSEVVKKYGLWVLAGVVGLSLAIAILPISHYTRCGTNNTLSYCGNCEGGFWKSMLWANYLIPIFCGVVALIFLTMTRIRIARKKNESSRIASRATKILSIPYIWMVFLIANGAVNLLADSGQAQEQGAFLYFYTILHKLMMLTPVVNLFFFIYMVRNLNELVQVKVRCCHRLLVKKDTELSGVEEPFDG